MSYLLVEKQALALFEALLDAREDCEHKASFRILDGEIRRFLDVVKDGLIQHIEECQGVVDAIQNQDSLPPVS